MAGPIRISTESSDRSRSRRHPALSTSRPATRPRSRMAVARSKPRPLKYKLVHRGYQLSGGVEKGLVRNGNGARHLGGGVIGHQARQSAGQKSIEDAVPLTRVGCRSSSCPLQARAIGLGRPAGIGFDERRDPVGGPASRCSAPTAEATMPHFADRSSSSAGARALGRSSASSSPPIRRPPFT